MKLLDKKSCFTQWLSKRQLYENANIRLQYSIIHDKTFVPLRNMKENL